jgi:hypothetical protein
MSTTAIVNSEPSQMDLVTRLESIERRLALLTNTDAIPVVEPVKCFADLLTKDGVRVTLARVNIHPGCEVTLRDAEITRLIKCMGDANVKTTNTNIIALGVGATSLYHYRQRHDLIKRKSVKRPRTEDVVVDQTIGAHSGENITLEQPKNP